MGWNVKYFNWEYFKRLVPLGVIVLVNVGLSLWGISMLDVPLFNILRRTQTLWTLLLDIIVFKRPIYWMVIVAVICMVGGAILTTGSDTTAPALGIFVTLLGVIVFAFQQQ